MKVVLVVLELNHEQNTQLTKFYKRMAKEVKQADKQEPTVDTTVNCPKCKKVIYKNELCSCTKVPHWAPDIKKQLKPEDLIH